MSGSQLLLLGGTPQVVSDPNFEYTTLLLPGNGTNGAQNNTFLDSSTNAFSITRNGNTTQGTFSPFSQTEWGVYQGAIHNDYASFTTSAGSLFEFTGDFTVEAWVYYTSNAADCSLWVTQGAAFFALNIDSTNYNIYLNSGSPTSSFSHGIALNAWTHVAMVRSGSTVTVYTNGVSRGTITNSSTLGYQNPTLARFGGGAAGSNTRYVSNLRIVKGTAVYTATFTPPTSPLTEISGTSLLTCQSNRFLDASTNALVPTVTGSPSVQAFSPFNPTASWSAATNGGSGYFDGSGDYLTAPDNAALDLSGDFTVEAWVYLPNVSGEKCVFHNHTSDNNGIALNVNSAAPRLLSGSGSWNVILDSSIAISPNCWNHIAGTRSGNTYTIWVNGVSGGTATSSVTPSYSGGAQIGRFTSGVPLAFSGYMANPRVVKGTAVYTTAFTPPTAPLTAIANTSLLLNFTNAGIYDATSKNDLETVGNAQISTTQSKFGGSSMYFDGTGDYLLSNAATTNLYAFGTGDFTVEMWIRFSAIGTDVYHFYDSRPASTDGAYPTLRTNASSQLEYIANSAVRITGATLTTNTWYHIALSRAGTSTKLFVDGVQSGSTYTDSTNYLNAALRPLVGGSGFHVTTLSLNGYIDDLRVTKGVARYTTNFTPPTAAFPLL